MTEHASLFSSVAVLAEFHPQAKALRFWRDENQQQLHAKVELYDAPLAALEELEADIALVSDTLIDAALPDFHAFCQDIEAIFHGSLPTGPVSRMEGVDWPRFRRISAYAQYWQDRNPREVNKLLTFMMGIPLYSQLLGRFITRHRSAAEQEIIAQTATPGAVYIMGVNRFNQLFREDIDTAINEAKLLVSTFRGTRDDNAAKIINGMVKSMLFH
ncbi:MAG: hypothetical protein HUJ23_09510 [Methylophaga sp.]|nr:hypothetical protein [Methylophaga sp.]